VQKTVASKKAARERSTRAARGALHELRASRASRARTTRRELLASSQRRPPGECA
jgi:hypothetical protein